MSALSRASATEGKQTMISPARRADASRQRGGIRGRARRWVTRDALLVLLALTVAAAPADAQLLRPPAPLDTERGRLTCFGAPVTIQGTAQGEEIIGTAGDDVIAAGAGPDTIRASLGDDRVCAGGGNDTVYGAAGDDRIDGGIGDDVVFGLAGNDAVSGGLGDDELTGGLGDDRLFGHAEAVALSNAAEDGNDRMNGDGGDDELHGGGGDDRLTGDAPTDVAGSDDLRGDGGNDTLAGSRGNDALDGGFGEDALDGGGGEDRLSGGFGNDGLRGGTESDVLGGGAGRDRLEGGAGDDSLGGGVDRDSMHGGSGRDRLRGGPGPDELRGNTQDDDLAGDGGADDVQGGAGEDRCIVGSIDVHRTCEAGRTVTAFDPGRHGFAFRNEFAVPFVVDTPLGRVDLGRHEYGLCGGMVWLAMDAFLADAASPTGSPEPEDTPQAGPVFEAIFARQVDSIAADSGHQMREMAGLQVDTDANVRARSVRDFDQMIRTRIDGGQPVPLGMVNARGANPLDLSLNHQVLAVGYFRRDRGAGARVLKVYDPNFPASGADVAGDEAQDETGSDADGITYLFLASGRQTADSAGEVELHDFRGVFTTRYVPKPPPWE
jgi:hypothetical protein